MCASYIQVETHGAREITPRILPDLVDFEKELFELPVKVRARRARGDQNDIDRQPNRNV